MSARAEWSHGLVYESESEPRSVIRRRLDPDAPSMTLDDTIANSEADSHTRWIDPACATLEHLEDPRRIQCIDADAVVRYRKLPLGIGPARRSAAISTRSGTSRVLIPDCVAHEILKELLDL